MRVLMLDAVLQDRRSGRIVAAPVGRARPSRRRGGAVAFVALMLLGGALWHGVRPAPARRRRAARAPFPEPGVRTRRGAYGPASAERAGEVTLRREQLVEMACLA